MTAMQSAPYQSGGRVNSWALCLVRLDSVVLAARCPMGRSTVAITRSAHFNAAD